MLTIINLTTVQSTNETAKNLIKKNANIKDTLIIAKTQTAGKGRLNDRVWASFEGNFHGTFIINFENLHLKNSMVGSLNSMALYAVYDELSKISGNLKKILIKLPNDILINQKKIAGVLVETSKPHACIGIGINLIISPVENSTNVKDEFGSIIDPEDLGQNIYQAIIKNIEKSCSSIA